MIAALERIRRGYKIKTTQGMSTLLFIVGVMLGYTVPLALIFFLAFDVFMAYLSGAKKRELK